MELNYPRTLNENIRYRINLLASCQHDKKLQKKWMYICSQNVVTWIDLFAWTKNPRTPLIAAQPFISYDFQVTTVLTCLDAIDNQYDLLLEKTREMGATWMVLLIYLWCWRFREGMDFKTGSWKEEFVDRIGDMGGHFEKMRFALRKLPPWMLPVGFDVNCPFMKIVNPENGNSITGETAGNRWASGDRRTSVFPDEFAKWEDSQSEGAWTSSADVTGCRIVVSTPFGEGNKYAQLAAGTPTDEEDGSQAKEIEVITLHWTLHPEKGKGAYYLNKAGDKIVFESKENAFAYWKTVRGMPSPHHKKGGIVRSPWYDKECNERTRTKEDIAQELDIDYAGSGYPFFDVRELLKQRIWKHFTRPTPTYKIPYGCYITGKIIKVDQKIEFREVPEEQGGWLRIFEMPEGGRDYGIGGDVCEGLPKGDQNFGICKDKITKNVVATICNNQPPEDFAIQLDLLHMFYFEAITGPENNNHGYTCCRDLFDLGTNLYYSKAYETAKGDQVTRKRGWSTNSRTRLPMLDELSEAITKHSFEVRDGRIIKQMRTFVRPEKKPNHPQASGKFKDDGVMALAIVGQIIKEHPFKPKKDLKALQRRRLEELRKKNALRKRVYVRGR